jgi:protoheme IX farnesyltransferase
LITSNTYQNQSGTSIASSTLASAKGKGIVSDLSQLVKLRLSTTVVFTAGMGYVLAAGAAFSIVEFLLLSLGGLLVTGSANAINEIIESDTDAKMERTQNRPLPTGRMSVTAALIAAGTFGVSGIALLWFMFNPVASLLGALSLLSYALIYTPMKRMTPFSVFVGAIPGAMPPAIGWAAVTGDIGTAALILFAIQFFWQFPHFWAIAWLAKDDYAKAGFDLLPHSSGRTKSTATHIVAFTAILIPFGLMPAVVGLGGIFSAMILVVCGMLFTWQSVQLYRTTELKEARQLMFGSFAYLPVVYMAMVIDKLI